MVLRTITMLLTMLFAGSFAFAASAEIYRWEDANGVNFTDQSSSVPEKFRDELFTEDDARPESTVPPVKVSRFRQNIPAAYYERKAAVQPDNQEYKRDAAEAAKQKQLQKNDFQNTLKSLALYIKIGAALGGILFIVWMVTIADIVRSEFITPSNKIVWLLLVLLLPFIGMLPYMYVGSNYKCDRELARNCPEPGHGVGVMPGC